MRQKDIKAIAALLEFDWPSPEDLAKAMIETYEQSVADRTTYALVMRMSNREPFWYVGVGYYPGEASARKAIMEHPAGGMAAAAAVVPIISKAGLIQKVAETDQPAIPDGDFALIREDAALYKIGWDGKQKSRKEYLARLERRK